MKTSILFYTAASKAEMTYYKAFLFFGITLFLTFFTSSCSSSSSYDGKTQKTIPKELDRTIRKGTLPNGFSYFIKSIPKSEPKLYMRLYHSAGSTQEDPDQFDVAHGVEHLAYKPTKNFPQGVDNSKVIKDQV